MPRAATNGYREIRDIKDDLSSLKDDVFSLSQHIQEDGYDRLHKMGKKLRARGDENFQDLGRRVKASPGRSLAIAFCVGLAASRLLGRR